MCATPIHGNYHGYYSKRPSVADARLALLPPNIFMSKRVLDIGCNEGWVTCEIAQSWGAHKVTGVDIDSSLVRAAWRRRLHVWSTQAPSIPESDSQLESTENERMLEQSKSYFPSSFEHSFGPLPVPPSQNRGKHVFPHNISFRASDWTRDAIPEDTEGYDVVLALSLSKWIHLNNGDDGLRAFFQRVYTLLHPGGVFILEPQEWETYKKARRTLQSSAQDLKLRPDDFEGILVEIGFGPAQHLGTTGEGGFRRQVDLYTKIG